jgi:hypothetical protein
MKNLILFVFLSLCFKRAFNQEVSASSDKSSILIGEQIRLQLRAEFKKEQNISWFQIDSIAHFEIMERSDVDTQRSGKLSSLSQILVLTSWDSGSWKIPSFHLNRVKTEPIEIQVGFSEMDPNQPYHDIKDIIPVKMPRQSKWYWYLVFAAVLIALFLLFFPSIKKNVEQPVAPVDAYEDALKKLAQLERKNVPDGKSFYTELVHIFREYVQRRRNILSFSKTTEDLSLQLKDLGLPVESYQQLVQTLQLSDMVKFAKYRPAAEERETSFQIISQNLDLIEKMPHAV